MQSCLSRGTGISQMTGLVLFFLCALTATSIGSMQADENEPIIFDQAMVLEQVGQWGRSPVHTDAVELLFVNGSWATPAPGDLVTLPDGTTKEWAEVEVSEDGWLRHRGYALWLVESTTDRVMILEAIGHSLVYVNGRPRAGDPYRSNKVRLPVQLRAGINEFLFVSSRGQIKAKLMPVKAEAMFNPRDFTLPNLIEGETGPVVAGVVIMNTTAEALVDLTLRVRGAGLPTRETTIGSIPPITSRKVAFWTGGEMPTGGDGRVQLDLIRRTGSAEEVLDTTAFTLQTVGPRDKQSRTFISEIDGSVQYYAVTPASVDLENPAMFLTLHGAGVEGRGQANAYAPKSWGHIVAPTNRRHFGFDWEDWGRLDFVEVMNINRQRLNVNPTRTYLTGHSMGGHGTWHIGVTFPDQFAAIGPSAGWISFWSYTGAARFEDADDVETVLMRAVNPSDTLALSRNYSQYGVYILHGEKDDNVPVTQAHEMNEHLAGFHDDFTFHEEPGAGHWWGNPCVDWDPMFAFFNARSRAAQTSLPPVEFHTANPGISAWSDWVGIESQIVPLDFSSATMNCAPASHHITGTTKNVSRLSFRIPDDTPFLPLSFTVDGFSADLDWPEEARQVWLTRVTDRDSAVSWEVSYETPSSDLKGPHRYGTFKDAFRNRMLFIYGTRGTVEENDRLFTKARYDAETFWYRGNGGVEVIPDYEFNDRQTRNRNIILYGNAETNGAWEKLLSESPVQVRRGAIKIGETELTGEDFTCLFVRPRPGSPTATVGVVAGTGAPGDRLSFRLPYFVSGIAYPDVTVLMPTMLTESSQGVVVAGFFGEDWSVEGGDFAWRE